jgi:uncharacterized membrane protein YdbT with pleckstrin-like domain
MFCKKCGSKNDGDAIYCKKCGALLEAEDETRVAQRNSLVSKNSSNDVVLKIFPTLKFIMAGYVLAALGAIVLAALLAFTPISPWFGVFFGLLLFFIPAYYHLRQRMTSYTLTDQCVEVDTGLISRTTRNIPIGRVQDVTVSSGLIQRVLNFGDVVVDNASEEGGKLVIRNIDSPRTFADKLLDHMKRLDK